MFVNEELKYVWNFICKSIYLCVATLKCNADFSKLVVLYSYFSFSAFSNSEENSLNAYYLKCLENLVQHLNSS